MRGKTVIFSLLFLPLWLAAVACNISAAPGADAGVGDQVSRSPDDQSGQGNSGKDLPPLKHAAHHLARRAAFSIGSADDLLTGAAEVETVSSGSQSAAALFSVVEAPADLRQAWQFHLRSACEPRAPSIVS